MSTVHIFVGQCGNQLGSAFLDALVSDAMNVNDETYQTLVSSTHFRRPLNVSRRRGETAWSAHTASTPPPTLPQPRCVMIDMEPKVIEQVMERANVTRNDGEVDDEQGSGHVKRTCEGGTSSASLYRSCEASVFTQSTTKAATATHVSHTARARSALRPLYRLAPQQCVTRGEGSASNWAYGYYHQGESRRESILECLRRENEASDTTVTTYHVLHSAAGGTGSGVGCLVADAVRDSYPHSTLMHTLVCPFAGGEVITQWYNLTLTLSTLSGCCDAVLLLYNEESRAAVMNDCATRSLRSHVKVGFEEINAHMSQLLTPLHLPQKLYAVPTPLRDRTRTCISGASREVNDVNRRSSSWSGGNRALHVAGNGAQETCFPSAGAHRRVRGEDVVESLALDPCRKFFVAAQSSAAGTASTTWPGVIQNAARVASDCFDVVDAEDESAGSNTGWRNDCRMRHVPCHSPGLRARSCLWALRGPRAGSVGVQELRHVMATQCSSSCSNSVINSSFPISSLWVSLADDTADARATCLVPEVSMYGPSSRIGEHMAGAVRRTEQLLSVNAFVHHFEANGVTKDDLRDASAVLWETIHAYTPSLVS